MNVPTDTTIEGQAQQIIIIAAINPVDGKPYALKYDPVKGLAVNANFSGSVTVDLDGAGTPPNIGDNVGLKVLNELDDGFVKVQADATRRALFNYIRGIQDKDGADILADDTIEGLQVAIRKITDQNGIEVLVDQDAVDNALPVSIGRIRDSAGNEGEVDATYKALKVLDQAPVLGYDDIGERWKMDIAAWSETEVKAAIQNLSGENEFPLDMIYNILIAADEPGTKQKALSADYTAERLEGSPTANYKHGITITAFSTNAETYYVGGSTVNNVNGFPLEPGESVPVDVITAYSIYGWGKTGDKVAWIGGKI